jgi:hypothetical protein
MFVKSVRVLLCLISEGHVLVQTKDRVTRLTPPKQESKGSHKDHRNKTEELNDGKIRNKSEIQELMLMGSKGSYFGANSSCNP